MTSQPSAISTPAAINAFFDALFTHDVEKVRPFLTDDVVEVIPFDQDGDREPFAVFDGKDAVLGYLTQITQMFSEIALVDRTDVVADEGRTVFVEARGELVNRATGAPYRNVYVFKFALESGMIRHVDEYANPVTFALMAGLPLGKPADPTPTG